MCCTTVLSMWLSNTSTTAMVMPIVEAVLQELVNAEEERDVISTAGSTIIEENEPIGICQYWPFCSHLSVTRMIDIYNSNSPQIIAVWFVLPKILVHSFSFCMVIFLPKLKDSFALKRSRGPNTCSVTIPSLPFYSCTSKLPSSDQVPEKISSGLVWALAVSDIPRKKEFGKKKISHFFQFTDSRLNNKVI